MTVMTSSTLTGSVTRSRPSPRSSSPYSTRARIASMASGSTTTSSSPVPVTRVGGLAVGGCTVTTGIPGVPDVQLEVSNTTAQTACKPYAQAFVDGTDRKGILAAVDAARATAAGDTGDADAQRVAAAIDQLLASTVMGTEESFAAAGDAVVAACRAAGVTITVERG